MEKKSFLFASFPPEFLTICSREIPLTTSGWDAAAGVKGQATKRNYGPRQAGELGDCLILWFPIFLE